MADNTLINVGSGGDTIRDLARQAGTIKTQVIQLDIGGVTGNAEVLVTAGQQTMAASLPVVLASNQTGVPTKAFDQSNVGIDSLTMGTGMNGLMIASGATNYFFSTLNKTTAQLAGGATFTGAIETIVSTQNISVLIVSDQPGIFTVNQYIDAGGTKSAQPLIYPVYAGIGFSRSIPANGNYLRVTFQNAGTVATTTLTIDVAFGTLPSTSNFGNAPVSLNEINGTAYSIGAAKTAASIPVNIASDQTVTVSSTDLAKIAEFLSISQSLSSDDNFNSRTLLDVLDPLGDNYIVPSAKIVTDDERPLRQATDMSGSLMVQPNVRNFSGSLTGLGIVASMPCADMSFIAFTVASANGNSILLEGYTANGWQSLFFAANSNANGTSYNNGSSSAAGQNNILANLQGCTAVRIRCSSYVGGITSVLGQLTNTQLSFVTLCQQSGTWNIGTLTTVTTVSTVTTVNTVSSVTAVAALTAVNTSALTNGSTVGTLVSAATTNLTQIKSSLGRIYMLNAVNTTTILQYIKLFALPSGSVSIGATPATLNFAIQPNGILDLNITIAGLCIGGSGISYAITTGPALADNTATTLGAVLLNYAFT